MDEEPMAQGLYTFKAYLTVYAQTSREAHDLVDEWTASVADLVDGEWHIRGSGVTLSHADESPYFDPMPPFYAAMSLDEV